MVGNLPRSVLRKVLLVLQSFTVEDTSLRFTEIQERTGLAKATLHRVLGELVDVRLLDRTAGRYSLSVLVFELGMRASVERALLEVATGILDDLHVQTQETVNLGVREGIEVVYLAKMGGTRQAKSPSRLGGRMPLHATAIGKVLLAYASDSIQNQVLSKPLKRCAPRTITNTNVLRTQLADVVKHGVAYEYEEAARGVVCVAAPIFGRSKEVLAAVSVTGPVHRFPPSRHAGSVRATAAGIAARLARWEELREH